MRKPGSHFLILGVLSILAVVGYYVAGFVLPRLRTTEPGTRHAFPATVLSVPSPTYESTSPQSSSTRTNYGGLLDQELSVDSRTAGQAGTTNHAPMAKSALWQYAIGRKLAAMSVRHKAAQTLMVGLPGDWSPKNPGILGEVPVGAVILYKRNVVSARQLRILISEIAAVQARLSDVRPFIAIDHEGGRVNRLPSPEFTPYPSNRRVAKMPNAEDAVREESATMARQLLDAGIDINLAPVVDVCTNPKNADIGDRSYGPDPSLVQRLGSAFIRSGTASGSFLVAKHFPGYGPIGANPHDELPVVDITRERWEQVHCPPFQSAIEAGVPGIMIGHVLYSALDSSGMPASLSRTITTELLRDDIGFRGLIMTDDLEMGAIQNRYGAAKAAVLALEAGADMVLLCHTPSRQRAALSTIVDAIEQGIIRSHQLDNAVWMVLWYKYQLGLWQPK